jgi:autotransporter-associated beta strand protein
VDVPVTIKADQSWSIASGSTLRFKSPVGMASPYAVAVSGAGTLRLDAPNGFHGGFAVSGGAAINVYSTTNAFGPANDTAVTLTESKLYLRGTTIERPVSINGSNNQYYWFASYAGGDGTNRITGALTVSNCTYWRPRVENVLVTENGVTVHCDVIMTGGGTWIVRGKPWVHSNTSSTVSALELTGNEKVHFQVAGNIIRRLKMASSCQVHCEVDNPFSGTTTLFCGNANAVMNLHGHEVSVSDFGSVAGGTVTSETPGTLVLSAQSGTITNSAVRFTGAAGFKMAGTGAVWFNRAMESAGSLAVSRGTFGFTANGSWANSTNVTVSGTGRLKVSKAKSFSKDAALSIADSGVVEIPEGVVLSVGRLSVDGETVTSGTFGSNDSTGDKRYASHFSGSGVLRVGKQGIMLMVW